jgi:hypothetical protein
VWALSAGRCAICNEYLLEGPVTAREVFLGEVAHIVGQRDTARSPRGKASMTAQERDSPANLMLICADNHDEIDDRKVLDAATVERLLGLGAGAESLVLRAIADVRGSAVELGQDAAATAVFASGKFPYFPLAYDRHSVEIDLRGVPGESNADAGYYSASKAIIDDVIDGRLRDGIKRDAVPHMSVFAFGRIPLLVYLGSRLDDTVPTSIFQRHRSSETWDWPSEPAATATFTFAMESEQPAEEGVLVLNVSGTIDPAEVPEELVYMPRYTVDVVGTAATMDVIDSLVVLRRFEQTVRELFSHLEKTNKTVRRLHVLSALPVSAAVVLGRVGNPDVHPTLLIYERSDHTYHPSLEVG